jgi:hypothetical protein
MLCVFRAPFNAEDIKMLEEAKDNVLLIVSQTDPTLDPPWRKVGRHTVCVVKIHQLKGCLHVDEIVPMQQI